MLEAKLSCNKMQNRKIMIANKHSDEIIYNIILFWIFLLFRVKSRKNALPQYHLYSKRPPEERRTDEQMFTLNKSSAGGVKYSLGAIGDQIRSSSNSSRHTGPRLAI